MEQTRPSHALARSCRLSARNRSKESALLSIALPAALVLMLGCERCGVAREQAPRSIVRNADGEQVCERDSDCQGDSLCACATSECSLCQSATECWSHIPQTCVSKAARELFEIPIHTSQGWYFEVKPDAGFFDTQAKALEAHYRWRFP